MTVSFSNGVSLGNIVTTKTDVVTGRMTLSSSGVDVPTAMDMRLSRTFGITPQQIIATGANTWDSDNSTVAVTNIGTQFPSPDYPSVVFKSCDMVPNNNTARARCISLTPFYLTSAVTLAMHFTAFPASGSHIQLSFSSDNFATKSITFPWNLATQYRANGVTFLTIGTMEDGTNIGGGSGTQNWVSAGGQLITDLFNSVKVNFVNCSGTAFKLLGVWTKKPAPKAKIMLCFDDGLASQYSIVYQQCQAYGIPVTIALPDALVGTGGYITQAQADEMYNSGIVDFIGHSHNHVDLTSVSATVCNAEVTENKTYLARYPRGQNCMAYPFNAYNASVLDICKKAGFRFMRSNVTFFVRMSAWGIDSHTSMGSYTLSSITLAAAKLIVDAAANTGQAVWLYGHNILNQNNPGGTGASPPGVATDWYLDDFLALLAYIVSKSSTIEAIKWSDMEQMVLSTPSWMSN